MSAPTPGNNGRAGGRRAPAKKAPARGRGKPRKPARKRPQGVKGWLLWLLKWGLIAGLSLFVLLAVVLFVAYQKTTIPSANEAFQTQTTNIYYSGGKTKIGQFAVQNRESIPYADMPDCMKQGVVDAENRTFWTDHGIDPKGIIRAAFSNAKGGGTTQGASTITQQYVKILYLNQERTYTRKVKEAFLSLKLQRTKSKTEILEGYLNTIYFGRGAYGIEAAAHAYFDKPAAKLDLQQCAVLSAVLNNPYRLDPANGESSAAALLQRYRYVLRSMADAGDITDAEAADASVALPKFPKVKASSAKGGQRGHMLALVDNELHQLGFTDEEITGGGLRVTTTFSKDAMTNAEESVKEVAPTETKDGTGKITDKQLHVGVASVQPGTGALLGFYGGQDFLKSEINWASAGGMAGSTMKPFTLATALESGFSLKDTFDGNSPFTFPGSTLQVHNEGEQAGEANGHSYGAHITALTALEQSVNTAFVDMSSAIPNGPKKIYGTATKMGLAPATPEQDLPGIPAKTPDLSPDDTLITLGKAQVSPINMANAYATIAAGGKRADVHVITKVVDRSGSVRYQWKNHTEQVIDPDIAADVAYAMQQVVKSGTGRSALALDRPAAGKTGTATNDDGEVSSAWFVGMTPQLSTAVMYVRGKGREQLDGWMPSYFGADYPTDTWLAVMERDLEGQEKLDFPPPAWVDGDAPDHEHEPVPTKAPAPPKPPKTKEPKPKKTQKPPPPPATTQAPPPPPATTQAPPSTTPPSPDPTDCSILGTCNTPGPGGGTGGGTGGGGGAGGGGGGGAAGRNESD
ncbi:Membrane carboxypeptidase (penicillin-binding protein) [Nocardioides terrae]|uniref:Membrane carboxypeptidase (Penicillin-binding protein) n=1 Tax=Nocardioides terrae TaxID=574651 RepID=A0A1I1MYP2_9ACTN|nr:transglycosylase domain-containing protein [Nocardioides terrae]SFC90574.1 Membrane carboxypeptidase (penicillin-binding protein) [Nocardioides terrae]